MPASTNSATTQHKTVFAAAIVLSIAGVLAYANSFAVPLILDDWATIQHNPNIRQIWPLWQVFSPPAHTGVGGRPIANLSFVLNYAISNDSLSGYHAINLLIHLAGALVLFGAVRRTLLLPRLRGRFGSDANLLGFAATAIWLLHPLQTQSVTYISQRTELLLGLFYFFTLYAFIRAVESHRPAKWLILSVVGCLAGMASKEGMVTAPLTVLIYDVLFVSGTVLLAWRQRQRYYLGLASTWVVLAVLMSGLRERGVGFGLGMNAWSYALVECRTILHYLALAFWPQSLVFDYGTDLASPGISAVMAALTLLCFASGIVVGLMRAKSWAFLGAWFFITLSPTSSIVPIPLQPIAENRTYVPLVAVAAATVLFLYALVGRRVLLFGCAIACALGVLAQRRNADYHSEISIWEDTVVKVPSSSRAHNNLGHSLLQAGRPQEAKSQFEIALRLRPDYAEAHSNLGGALGQLGMDNQAIDQSRLALRLDPKIAAAYYNLGVGLNRIGDVAGAATSFEAALNISPEFPGARSNLAEALLRAGRPGDAIIQDEIALKSQPQSLQARFTLGCALSQTGRIEEAVAAFRDVIHAQPAYVDAYYNLGTLLLQLRRVPEAIANYEKALRINPNQPAVHNNLASALLSAGRVDEAIVHGEAAVKLNPKSPEAHCNLGLALVRSGRSSEAVSHFEDALSLNPDFTLARESLMKLVAHPNINGGGNAHDD